MNWTSIKEISKIYNKPERTIRHYAAQGKIRVKKDGSKWLCDLNSIHQLGWVRIDSQNKVVAIDVLKQQLDPGITPKLKKQTELPGNTVSKDNKKQHSLESLGVYSELLQLLTKIKPKLVSDSAIEELLSKTILSLALGFYEFQPNLKARHFSEARQYLVQAMVKIHLRHLLTIDPDSELIETKKQIEESLLPGVGGLIRRMEKRIHAREPRPPSFTKN